MPYRHIQSWLRQRFAMTFPYTINMDTEMWEQVLRLRSNQHNVDLISIQHPREAKWKQTTKVTLMFETHSYLNIIVANFGQVQEPVKF